MAKIRVEDGYIAFAVGGEVRRFYIESGRTPSDAEIRADLNAIMPGCVEMPEGAKVAEPPPLPVSQDRMEMLEGQVSRVDDDMHSLGKRIIILEGRADRTANNVAQSEQSGSRFSQKLEKRVKELEERVTRLDHDEHRWPIGAKPKADKFVLGPIQKAPKSSAELAVEIANWATDEFEGDWSKASKIAELAQLYREAKAREGK